MGFAFLGGRFFGLEKNKPIAKEIEGNDGLDIFNGIINKCYKIYSAFTYGKFRICGWDQLIFTYLLKTKKVRGCFFNFKGEKYKYMVLDINQIPYQLPKYDPFKNKLPQLFE